jgi:hypothetical protein
VLHSKSASSDAHDNEKWLARQGSSGNDALLLRRYTVAGTLLRIARILEDVFVGGFATRARLGLIIGREGGVDNAEELSSVGGVLGLGFSNSPRSASIIKTLTAAARPSWNIEEGLIPCTTASACRSKHMAGSGMAKRRFSFLAAKGGGGAELQLGAAP